MFGDVIDRVSLPLVNITNTYRYVSRALRIAGTQIALEEVGEYERSAKDPQFANIFAHNYQEIHDRSFEVRVGEGVLAELQIVERRVASSALVFAHSIFEVCVSNCLMISFLAGPDDWMPLIENKKLSIADLRAGELSVICSRLVCEKIEALEKESLMVKLDTFFRITAVGSNSLKLNNYKYDRKRVNAIDSARHRAAHHDPAAYNPALLSEDATYLWTTVLFLLVSCNL